MDFADQILVRLADEDQRANLFSEASLETMAMAAYHVEAGQLAAPWAARFDVLDWAPSIEPARTASADLHWEESSKHGIARFSTSGLAALQERLQPIAYWGGAIIGQGRLGGGRVAQVSGGFVSLEGIDEAIDAAAGVGAEPQGTARETARLTELSNRLSQAAGKPGSITTEVVRRWVDETAGGNLESLLNSASVIDVPAGFRIRFVSDAPSQDLPMALGVDAVVFAFDTAQSPFGLAEAIRATHSAQEQIAIDNPPSPGVGGIDRRLPVLGIWVVPQSWFNDDSWPGTSPSDRLSRANKWLRRKGIAIVFASGP